MAFDEISRTIIATGLLTYLHVQPADIMQKQIRLADSGLYTLHNRHRSIQGSDYHHDLSS